MEPMTNNDTISPDGPLRPETGISYHSHRRNELASKFDRGSDGFSSCSQPLQDAIDYIISIEPKPVTARSRIHSRDIAHLREDLEASFRFAFADDYEKRAEEVAAVLAGLESYRDSQQVLRDVKNTFGAALFGKVTLYHQEHRTSLMGQSEAVTSRTSLRELGMTVADLGWPADVLNPAFVARYPGEV